MKIIKFYEQGFTPVYSDMIVLMGNQIHGISIIGSEIVVKAYRAKFMDNVMAKANLRFWYEDKIVRLAYKPAQKYTVFPQVVTEQGLQVVMMNDQLIWGISQEDLLVKVYQLLYDLNIPCPLPAEDNFEDCMQKIFDLATNIGFLTPCQVVGNVPYSFYMQNLCYLDEFREDAEKIIAEYIKSAVPGLLDGIDGVADYIEKFSLEIGEKIGQRVSYLHTPGDYDDSFFEQLNRKLFPQQKDISVAASKRLVVDNHVIISGQMGTGKTTLGVAACHHHANGKPYRTIVTCPGHLVEKWAREVKEIIPEAKAFIFTGKNPPWLNFWNQYKNSGELTGAEYWIVSNESLRGGYIQRPGYVAKKRFAYDPEIDDRITMKVATCPKCGEVLVQEKKIDGIPIEIPLTPYDFRSHTSYNHKCKCGEMLWQADGKRKGFRKTSIADLIKKRIPKNFFTYFIADEAHMYKGSTAQGLAFGGVISRTKKVIAMTGTMADGYANGLYYLLWRMCPEGFKSKGFNHDEESRSRFQSEYGFWTKTVRCRDDEYGRTSRAKSTRSYVKPLPGYTINTFPEWLIERTCFLKLSDVAPYLPPKTEYVNAVDMDEDLAEKYRQIENRLRNEIKDGGSRVASIMLHTCMSYPDIANGPEVIDIEKGDYSLHYVLPSIDKDRLYNKEKELQSILESELSQNRKCLVFSTYSNLRDCLSRLEWVASQVPQARVQVMRANTVSASKRESWVKDKLKNINTLICHPELVETGLDLLECKTIIWIQTGYIPSTVRQASARSLRIGQTDPIKVIFLCYKDTLQEKCFQLIGSKLNAAGILEGNLSNEGLRRFGNDGSMHNDLLSLLSDNIITANSNDIFESYKAEVATLLAKTNPTVEEIRRLKTLTEVLTEMDIDMSHLTPRQKKQLLKGADIQPVLFM
jgi:hypothetical protein